MLRFYGKPHCFLELLFSLVSIGIYWCVGMMRMTSDSSDGGDVPSMEETLGEDLEDQHRKKLSNLKVSCYCLVKQAI